MLPIVRMRFVPSSGKQSISRSDPVNDAELNEIVCSCGGPYPKGHMTAEFIPSKNMVVKWRRSTDIRGREYLNFQFPETFKLAPVSVIKDITKKLIQQVCYSSDSELSEDTLEWLVDLRRLTGRVS